MKCEKEKNQNVRRKNSARKRSLKHCHNNPEIYAKQRFLRNLPNPNFSNFRSPPKKYKTLLKSEKI